MKGILVLTLPDARFGFALAGVHQREIAPEEAWEVIREAMADPRIGVLAADERLLATVDPYRLSEVTARWSGVMVTLPAPAGAMLRGADEFQRLVRRALGYHVKL